ncbi:hypothetical protein CICLE_v10029802mg [Citrus x clementina]|uniref:Uncharacterized protein n=2 Tax=Citrus TaxID=2706 RepID=V4SH56_CITCL|nr:hypothetical protein CICLE_v10029802mg [Citrus x clementina]GAY51851.1 hypothetical protein CUMW_137470 [Citrus unshiu]
MSFAFISSKTHTCPCFRFLYFENAGHPPFMPQPLDHVSWAGHSFPSESCNLIDLVPLINKEMGNSTFING